MIDYAFYRDTYHGDSIPEMEWPPRERDAAAKLRQYKQTYQVTAETPEAESLAICALADVYHGYHNTRAGGGAVLSSVSVGGVSESYDSPGDPAAARAQMARDLYSAAALYLSIYRGCGA